MFIGLAPLFVAFVVYLISLRLNPYRKRDAEQFAAFNGYSIAIGAYLGGFIAVVLTFLSRLFTPDLHGDAAIAFLIACQVLTLIVSRIVFSVRARRADP